MVTTTIEYMESFAYRETNILRETNHLLSTVDVFLDMATKSVNKITRLADGKILSMETHKKDRSREIVTFNEFEEKMSTQRFFPNGRYELHDANGNIVYISACEFIARDFAEKMQPMQ